MPGRPNSSAADRADEDSVGDFAARFRQAHRVLWLLAAGLAGDRHLAEDIVQDAALIALKKLDQFEPGTNFTAWMSSMVRNVALNVGRRETRRRMAPLNDEPARTESSPTDRMVQSGLTRTGAKLPEGQVWFDDQVLAALNSLSDSARTCLLLRTVEGLEYSEISRMLDIPEGTAMSHVHRARQSMRARLARSGSFRATDARTKNA